MQTDFIESVENTDCDSRSVYCSALWLILKPALRRLNSLSLIFSDYVCFIIDEARHG